MTSALDVFVRGVVQGVGFRPFVYRLAHRHRLTGWVLNAEDGVTIHLEGTAAALTAFVAELESRPPPAARIAHLRVEVAAVHGFASFDIRGSEAREHPTTRISPDLPICPACLAELFDPQDRRYRYPYINCTDCGPRYTIILGLPYDRPQTTMKAWPMCQACEDEYSNPLDRRFHAQPVACPECGPHYYLRGEGAEIRGDEAAIRRAAGLLSEGRIVAVKGLGGYHLACDVRDAAAVAALRQRKFRKEQPFALMVQDVGSARELVGLPESAEKTMTSTASPILLAVAKERLAGVAPDNRDLGVMLPYTPLHHLLFAYGAPETLVLTSANRSSEPIAYRDDEALERLDGLADAFLIGERPIARRVDDSVARADATGPVVLRRARGYAPSAVCTLPGTAPVLAVGADLKNSITLVVDGQAFVSQHIGDLSHAEAFAAFKETIGDLIDMYAVDLAELTVVHDLHPQYVSTLHALELAARAKSAVQHHRAHIASVAAEREAWETRVVGLAFDGSGYGDDGAIWGGEFFVGSIAEGFSRAGHLRYATLPGGDAAARHPVQAAAGFLNQIELLPDVLAPPYDFGTRYTQAMKLVDRGIRTFPTTSAGRLFDTVAALLGFTRSITFEGQAAIWLEHLASPSTNVTPYPCPWNEGELDFRPLIEAVLADREAGRDVAEIARAFHRGLAAGAVAAARQLCKASGTDVVAVSGGVFQNRLLLEEVAARAADAQLQLWTQREVPPNDGGISLGQAALGALGPADAR